MSSAPIRSGLSADRPFPGLRPYRFEDRSFFFGREDQIFSLYRLFDHSRFVAVVGNSGSGKSSLVRAGLLPLLDRESDEPTGRTWKMIQMHPGDAPIGSLAAAMVRVFFPDDDPNIAAARRERLRFALRRSSFGMSDALREADGLGDTSVILVVDQFEELFRYAARPLVAELAERHEEATQFVQMLLSASRDRSLNVYVLLTMRSDFIGDCASFRDLPEAVSASQFLVPSLTRDQREEAIRGPIRTAGAAIEPSLVERLLNDNGEEIDQLPVLQHCLLRVWEAAAPTSGTTDEGRCLTVQHYLAVGGVAHALSNHAEEVLKSLAGDELAVEQIFRSLAEIDLEGRVVRRARLFKELLVETGIPELLLRKVLDRFREDDCSFLTPPTSEVMPLTADARVDVGHEALLRRWERVSGDPRTGSPYTGWLRAEVADGRSYRGLLAMAESKGRIGTDTVEGLWKRWQERPRTAAWAERYGGHIEEVEQVFLTSLAARAAERDRERRQAELEREQERRRIEEDAERQRMQLQADASRERKSAALRIAKLTRRAAIVVFLLLIIAVGLGAVAVWQWRIADQQRIVATQEATTAQANFDKSFAIAHSVATKLKDLLDKGAISVAAAEQLFTGASKNFPQFTATDNPTVLTSWFTFLISAADIYMALEDNAMALQVSRQAQSIAKQLATIDPNNPQYQFQLYEADFNCGDAEAGSSTTDAMRDYSAALAIAQTLAQTELPDYVWTQRAAFVTNKIGDVDQSLHQLDRALAAYKSAAAINLQLVKEHSDVPGLHLDLATAMLRVGDIQAEQNDTPDALDQYKSALMIRQTIAKSPNNAGNASVQSNLSVAYSRVAGMFAQQNDFPDAAANYQSALQIRINLASSDASNPTWQSALAEEYVDIGDMLMKSKNFSDAVDKYNQSVAIRSALVGRDSGNFDWMRNLAESYSKLAAALIDARNSTAAMTNENTALTLRIKLGAQYPDSAAQQRALIYAYLALGDLLKSSDRAGAAAEYQSALKVGKAFLAGHPTNAAIASDVQTVTQDIQGLDSK